MSKTTFNVERVFSLEKDCDFESAMKLIIAHKIEDLVNNENKVNTATSQTIEEGIDHS